MGGHSLQATSRSSDKKPGIEVTDGPKISNYESVVKSVFSDAKKIEETAFLPRTSGGSTFVGLVRRLLGEITHREYESIDMQRYIYKAFDRDGELLGVVHASEFESGINPKVRVDIFYDTNGVVKDLKLEGVPNDVLSSLHKDGSLAQFLNATPEDFEIKRNRRGRISKKGEFLRKQKFPPSKRVRKYYESIVRAVRFNAAFMDVSFFITQHPNLDKNSRQVRVNLSQGGPEAYVSSAKIIKHAKDDSVLLMNDLDENN